MSLFDKLFGGKEPPAINIPGADEKMQLEFGREINTLYSVVLGYYANLQEFIIDSDYLADVRLRAMLEFAKKPDDTTKKSKLFMLIFIGWLSECREKGEIVVNNSLIILITLSKKAADAGREEGMWYFYEEMGQY